MSGLFGTPITIMRLTACYTYAVLARFLVTTVAAQRDEFDNGPGFDAPPLETANLAFYTVLLFATLIQVVCAISYFFRGRPFHLLPGISVIIAFLFLAISYALGIAITVAAWTFDQDSAQIIDGLAYLHIDVAASLFFSWVDPAIFTAVALVLRDRYHTYSKYPVVPSAPDRSFLVPPFTLFTYFFLSILIVTSSASAGIFAAAYTGLYKNTTTDEQFNTQIRLSNRFDYAFVAFSILTTIFLTVFAFVVKGRAKTDKIVSATLFYITPALCFRALARLLFEIINALLPLSSAWTYSDAFALDLASTVVYGVLFFIAASTLLYFLLSPRLWDVTYQQRPYGSSSHQQFAYPLHGVEPTTQFPGQGQPHNRLESNLPHPDMGDEYSYPPAAGAYHTKEQPPFQEASPSDTAIANKTLQSEAIPP